MVDTVIRLIGARRAQPGDDLISDLVQVSDETEKLDEVELVALLCGPFFLLPTLQVRTSG
ncbi:hypothetical protein DDQ41_10760 [Streptomyces spongiicola]|uniref:Uncharacterized protein n=2 Tax=Streptomyces spongiicola TaxID=1690221 RepID=A0ABM6V5T0_9ACTN|nr:hypothetical protein [Streptomyces spongiicola]AWK09322.1 hypothetical protein DDQ41_10760 [Streptomyces spongiicola]